MARFAAMRFWEHEDALRVSLAVGGLAAARALREAVVGDPVERWVHVALVVLLVLCGVGLWGRNRAATLLFTLLVALCAVDFVSQVEAGFRLVVAGGLLVLLVPLAISVHQTFSWHRTLAGGRAPGWTVPVMLGTLLAGIAAGALVLQLRLHDGFGVRDEAGIPESHGEVLRAMGALPKDEPILAYTSLGARAPRQGFALYSARRLVFGAEASHAMPLEDILGMELARGTSKRNPSIVVLTCLGRTESFTLDPRGGTDLEFYEGLRGAWERAREAALPDPLLRATDLETLRARGELVPVRPEDRERIRKERGLPAKQTPPPGRHAK